MATEMSPDGENILHNGASIYLRRVMTLPDQPVKYRVQIYRDNLPGHKFYQSFEVGSLQHAQEFALTTADELAVAPVVELICPACGQKAKFPQAEADTMIYCEYHDVPLITLAAFEGMVASREIHPDDFEAIGQEGMEQ